MLPQILAVSGQDEPQAGQRIEFQELPRLHRQVRGDQRPAVIIECHQPLVEECIEVHCQQQAVEGIQPLTFL